MNSAERKIVEPYHALASGYDVVMEHVAYDEWAPFIHRIISRFLPDANRVFELGCGTGSFSLALQPLGNYRYSGTDRSDAMIAVAGEKAAAANIPVAFEVGDFTGFRLSRPADVILLMYDGVNYLTEDRQIADLLRCALEALVPGGLFIFDVSTPENSLNNAGYFDDEGEAGPFRYVRRNEYDEETRLHRTYFEIDIEGRRYAEIHIQRAYSLGEMRALISGSDFEVMASYDDFSTRTAGGHSERIHWVLRRPAGLQHKVS